MPQYTYEVREQSGDRRRGTLRGDSAEAVARELRAQGYFVVTVQPTARPSAARAEGFKRRVLAPIFYPVSSKHRALFFSSLRALMSAGMGVSEAMSTLSKRTQNRILAHAAAEMAEEAIRGRPMTSVMGKYPSAFTPAALAVMQAGEESGLLEQTAHRLATYFDKSFEIEQAYRWHTFYPKVLLIALVLIPTAPTLVLGSFGSWLSLILTRSLPILLGVGLVWYGWRVLMQIPAVKRALDAVKLRLPWFGSLSRRISTARWARALAMLLAAGVPVHRSLIAAASATGNAAMEDALVQEAGGVMEGKTVSEVLTATGHLPEMALDMLATAERAGSIEDALEKVADYYESETDVGGKQTAIAAGIFFYLLVALAIGFVVISFWTGYFGQYSDVLGP